MRTSLLPALLLGLLAAATGWLLWQLRQPAPAIEMVGPPRSDYSLYDFELVALDAAGRESFAATAPRLERHPQLGTIDIEQPRLVFPDRDGRPWAARAERAWVDREATELQLRRDVLLVGPPAPAEPLRLVTEQLSVFPRENRIATEAAVTVTEPGSILRGRGLRADLDARRVELLSEVRIEHEPPARRR